MWRVERKGKTGRGGAIQKTFAIIQMKIYGGLIYCIESFSRFTDYFISFRIGFPTYPSKSFLEFKVIFQINLNS